MESSKEIDEYLGIHKIQLKKRYFDESNLIDFNYVGKPKETSTLIVLTHLPARCFIPKTFFKQNHKDKMIIYGTLKPQYKNLQGAGIFSDIGNLVSKGIQKVKSIFSPRLDGFNNASSGVLKQYGDVQVDEIFIYRRPINHMVSPIINAITFGKWNSLLKQYGFDKLFHLALVFKLSNNKTIIVEKGDHINISDTYKTEKDTDVFKVAGYTGGKTVYDFINGARTAVGNDAKFFSYDAFNNNCQYFIKYILEAAGLYGTAEKDFLFQDLSKVADALSPTTKYIVKSVTNIGATINKLTGKGKYDSQYEKHVLAFILAARKKGLHIPPEILSKLQEYHPENEMDEEEEIEETDEPDIYRLTRFPHIKYKMVGDELVRLKGSGKRKGKKKVGGSDVSDDELSQYFGNMVVSGDKPRPAAPAPVRQVAPSAPIQRKRKGSESPKEATKKKVGGRKPYMDIQI
jgi:hypothetical protein